MRRLIAAVLALVSAVSMAACTGGEGGSQISPPKPGRLRVLAGSELADMRAILDEAATATGVRVELTFSGTLEGAETLARGEADGKFDAIWFSSNRYPESLPEANRRLGNRVKIMSSPVLLGLSSSTARRLGWEGRNVGWGEIAAAAGQRAFSYGMTDPSASNSGFSALVGVASALAGAGRAVDAAQIASVAPKLTDFFRAQVLSAGSSGWLSEAYQRRATGADPGQKVDGLINYESVLLSMTQVPEPLTIVYPSDGVVTADYPLTLLADAGDDARSSHQRLSDYLRTPDVQRKIMDTTYRRPAVPGVALSDRFGGGDLVELPFPATGAAVDALLSAYFNQIRRPSRTLYVLDTSGSMAEGGRLDALRTALVGLTGADGSLVGKYRSFRGREEVTLLPFSTTPAAPSTFVLPEIDPQAELGKITRFAGGLTARGGTAIYDSLLSGYRLIGQQAATDPDRFHSIVLMTDGENQDGSGLAEFEQAFAGLPQATRQIPVFTVLFGEGNQSEMDRVAALTGGRVFDGRSGELSAVFQEIRGYQ